MSWCSELYDVAWRGREFRHGRARLASPDARHAVIVPAGHPWPDKISLPELEAEPFIIREKGSGSRDTLEKYLKDKKDIGLSRFNVIGELGSSEAVREAVISGLGASIISIHAVRRELEQGILRQVSIAGFHIERNFHLIYKKQFDLMPYHKLFLKFLHEHYRGGQRG